MTRPPRKSPFPSAHEDAKSAGLHVGTPQCTSPSYRLAFQDDEFVLRDELRPVRLQLELMKPELLLQENNIKSTIVVFGSARLKEPEEAQKEVERLQELCTACPEREDYSVLLRRAQNGLKYSMYYNESRKLGRLISQNTEDNSLVVITGGGEGIMGAANRGAHDVGAKNIGLNIVLPFEQRPNEYITPELSFQFHYFAIRKMHFLIRARGMVAFPGGFGTMDELFESLTLIQTGKVKPFPVLLFGREFWDRVINFEALVEAGTISEKDLRLFQYVETAEQAWDILSTANGY
ncbi:LOG family protein [Desulfoplanes sp.]